MLKIRNFIIKKKNDYEQLILYLDFIRKNSKNVDFFFLFFISCGIILIHCIIGRFGDKMSIVVSFYYED